MMPALGLTNMQMGQIFSAFVLGYALVSSARRVVGRSVGSQAGSDDSRHMVVDFHGHDGTGTYASNCRAYSGSWGR